MKRIHHKKLSNNKLGHRARQKRERFRNMWADDIFLCLINGCVGVRRAISAWSERFHYDQPICIAINYQRGMFRLPSAVAGIFVFELIRLGCGWFRRKRRDEIAKCEATFAKKTNACYAIRQSSERKLSPWTWTPTRAVRISAYAHPRRDYMVLQDDGASSSFTFYHTFNESSKGGIVSCRPTLAYLDLDSFTTAQDIYETFNGSRLEIPRPRTT